MAEPASQGDSVVAQSPELKNALKTSPDTQIPVMTRERSFIRTSNNQNNIKRRSLALNQQISAQQYSNPIRGKPAMELYRPPNNGEARWRPPSAPEPEAPFTELFQYLN